MKLYVDVSSGSLHTVPCTSLVIAMYLRLCHYRYGHLTVVQYLVEKCSADVNLKDIEGCTPLHDACG